MGKLETPKKTLPTPVPDKKPETKKDTGLSFADAIKLANQMSKDRYSRYVFVGKLLKQHDLGKMICDEVRTSDVSDYIIISTSYFTKYSRSVVR